MSSGFPTNLSRLAKTLRQRVGHGMKRSRYWYKKIAQSPGAAISLVLLIVLALTAIFAPILSPRDPYATYVGPRLAGPTWQNPV